MRVGTSKKLRKLSLRTQDHPHACGDKIYVGAYLLPQIGSSPCVWGQGSTSLFTVLSTGIIPMRVGTRTKVYHDIMCIGDHPHACGDKSRRFELLPI